MRLLWMAAAAAAWLLVGAGPANATWYRAESRHFNVYGEGPAESVKSYAAKLEDFDSVLRRYHGLTGNEPVTHKLDVYLVSSESEFHRIYPNAQAIGVYVSSPDDIFAVAVRNEPGMGDDTMFHEYVHHFMLQYFPSNYPAWLIEGWAEYFATTVINGKQVDVGKVNQARAQSLFDTWVPMNVLLGSTTETIRPEQSFNFYAEAWLLTHFMLADNKRKDQLVAYMRAVNDGVSPVTAMETATGESLGALEKQLRAYTRGHLTFVRIDRASVPTAAITVTRLPDAADDLLVDVQKMKARVAKAEQPDLLKRVRAKASKHPGDKLAQLALARAEIQYGDRSAGEGILTRYLQSDGADLDALLLLANSYLDQAEKAKDYDTALAFNAKAKTLLVKAYAVDPNSYQVLYAYTRTHRIDPNYPDENTLNALLLSQQLAPQVEDIRLAAAAGLISRRRDDDAVALLTPLANSPHGGEEAEAAKKLLAQVKANRDAETAKASPAAP